MGAVKRSGCRACELNLRLGLQQTDQVVECHHITRTVRLGHDATLGLCQFHHRALLPKGHTTSSATAAFGPSLAKGSKPFIAKYGTEASLLKRQNEILGIPKRRILVRPTAARSQATDTLEQDPPAKSIYLEAITRVIALHSREPTGEQHGHYRSRHP